MIIYGSEVSKRFKEEMKNEVSSLNRAPSLCVILVGDNPASLSYIRGKEKACNEIGIKFTLLKADENISEENLVKMVKDVNDDESTDGLIVQMPLPKHINTNRIMEMIDPSKDVDGLNPLNIGRMVLKEECFVPCTPLGVMALIKETGVNIIGKRAVVMGRSALVGIPLAHLLMKENATVTIVHSKTENIKEITSQADILVAAIGQSEFVKADYVREGAIVIDVGINRIDGKLKGDVAFDEVEAKASYITPVPKGVGPMTVTMLLENTIKAYKLKHD